MDYIKTTGGKKLSFIGLGCWRFGEPEDKAATDNPGKSYWGGGQDRKDSLKTLDAALRGGITHFDTAQSYGNGKSEQITGQRLRKERDNCVISTKIMIDRRNVSGLEKKIELSLKRLNTDYIDILYIHWPSDSETIKQAVNSMEKARYSGRIRHTGVSNFSVNEIRTAMKEGSIDFCQTGYSFLWRRDENDVIPFCIENRISVIAYSFLAQGILTDRDISLIGKRTDDRRRNLVFFRNSNEAVIRKTLYELKNISIETGYSIIELLISWGKSKQWLDSVLTGAKNRKQIEELIASEKCLINKEITDRLDRLSSGIRLKGTESGNIFSHT